MPELRRTLLSNLVVVLTVTVGFAFSQEEDARVGQVNKYSIL